MNVVETCTGSATPLVSGSTVPSACAAMVRGFNGLSCMQFSGTDHSRRGSACKTASCKRRHAARYARRGRDQDRSMADFLYYYGVPIAVGAVAIVLLLGLANMLRGGSPDTSQRLMRLRVLLQFVAIVVIMITVWAMGR